MKNKNKYHKGAQECGRARSARDTTMILEGFGCLPELSKTRRWEREGTRFVDVIGDGYRCFYLIEELDGDRVLNFETGVGLFEINGDQHLLHRQISMTEGVGITKQVRRTLPEQPPQKFDPEDGAVFRITSIQPNTTLEFYAAPNTILASSDSYTISPVEIEENALLGRKDDIIQSIDKEEFKEMMKDAIIESFTESQKQHDVKTRRINLTRKNAVISTPVVRLAPDNYNDTEKPPAQQGMIIYNTDKKCLEFFNGDKWIRIAEED
tara:strand:+ start:534 stop:1331 length:798 start_codon:yes stop_codon:yes gene_type:complete